MEKMKKAEAEERKRESEKISQLAQEQKKQQELEKQLEIEKEKQREMQQLLMERQ